MRSIILDTDIGFDPDDLFALFLAWRMPDFDIDLIVTADEVGGKRAAFTEMILKRIGYSRPEVVEGFDLGNENFVVDELLEKESFSQRKDYIQAIKEMVDKSTEPALYIGIGGFTNLANFLREHPQYKDKLKIYMMGGAIDYSRGEDWAEHNVGLDIDAARYVLQVGCDITFIMAQTTFNSEYEINNKHRIFRKLKESNHEAYQMLARHCELFHDYLGSKYGREIWPKMHDPLTLAVASDREFVKLHSSPVSISLDGKIKVSDAGNLIRWSDPISKDKEFMTFLEQTLFNNE